MSKNKLIIPQGIRLQEEIYNGFSKVEVIQTIKVMIVVLIVDIILFIVFRNAMLCVGLFMLILFMTIVILIKDIHTNISAYDQIRFLMNYSSGQKSYPYKYYSKEK